MFLKTRVLQLALVVTTISAAMVPMATPAVASHECDPVGDPTHVCRPKGYGDFVWENTWVLLPEAAQQLICQVLPGATPCQPS